MHSAMTSRRSPRSNGLPAEFVQHAKIVVLLADGVFARAVETKIQAQPEHLAASRKARSVDGLWKLLGRRRSG